MIRRSIAIATTGLTLACVPAAAMAYTPDPDALQTSATSALAGSSIQMILNGDAGQSSTLTVNLPNTELTASLAGEASLSKDIAGDGVAEYTVTFPEGWSGTAAVSAYVEGQLVDTQAISVLPAAQAGEDGSLSGTGPADMSLMLAGAAGALIAGAGAVTFVARRRAAAA